MGNPIVSSTTITWKDRGLGRYGSVELTLLDNYAIGVPHPQNYYEYDPLTKAPPSDPAAWPSAEDPLGLFYYIDNTHGSATDTANTYGYPNQPRLTIPNGTFPAGTVIYVKGGGSAYTTAIRFDMTFNGTVQNPCFLIAVSGTAPKADKEFRFFGGSHLIIDGWETVRNTLVVFNFHYDYSWEFMTVRDCTLVGNSAQTNGNVIDAKGVSNSDKSGYLTLANCTINNWGENLSTSPQNDMHAFKPDSNIDYIWYLGNTLTNLGGDCIQVGSGSTPYADVCQYVYIAKNDMSNTLENAVDLKRCKDVIISENDMYDFKQVNSVTDDTFAATVVHSNTDWATFIANRIWDSGVAMSNTDGTNVHFICNEVWNINPVGTYTASSAFTTGSMCEVRGTSSGTIANNTLFDYSKGIQIQANLDLQIFNNIFAERNRSDGYELQYATSGDYAAGDNDYNIYYNPVETTEFKRGSTVESLATYQTSTSREANAQTGDPDFTNTTTNDYTISASSSARNNARMDAIYAALESRYPGIDFTVDIAGIERPKGSAWDMGANEYDE